MDNVKAVKAPVRRKRVSLDAKKPARVGSSVCPLYSVSYSYTCRL